MTPFAAYLLAFAVPTAGLGAWSWDVRAESQYALYAVHPLGIPFAESVLRSADPEVSHRAAEVIEGRQPRVRPAPVRWEPWPKNRLR